MQGWGAAIPGRETLGHPPIFPIPCLEKEETQMTEIDNFLVGFITGIGMSWLIYIVYLDVRGKMERFLFLRWKEKARYWIGY